VRVLGGETRAAAAAPPPPASVALRGRRDGGDGTAPPRPRVSALLRRGSFAEVGRLFEREEEDYNSRHDRLASPPCSGELTVLIQLGSRSTRHAAPSSPRREGDDLQEGC